MYEFKMPQLGESVVEGTIGKWLVKPGDVVKKFDPIAEVATDKVNTEIPSPVAGRVVSLDVAEGETVKVGTRIMTFETDEAPSEAGLAEGAAPTEVPSVKAGAPSAAAPEASPPANRAVTQPASVPAGGRGRYSPAVLALAQQHGVDLSQVVGTGEGGRITRKDVEAFVALRTAPPAVSVPAAARTEPSPSAPPTAGPPSLGVEPGTPGTARPSETSAAVTVPAEDRFAAAVRVEPGDQVVPLTPIRRAIAERMVASKQRAPHAWVTQRADVTGLVQLKQAQGEAFKQREGMSLTFLPFFIKAVVQGLKAFPIVNSQWGGDKIVVKRDLNISIAVALEDALVVPVIKRADQLSLVGLQRAVHDLVDRARAGRLTMADIEGGTFTVNNTGALGSFVSQPIINYPQAAIVSFEAIVREPVVLPGDLIAIRSMMNLCLSLDHRILDGLVASRFLSEVKTALEAWTPEASLT